jgi:hypothetical protein
VIGCRRPSLIQRYSEELPIPIRLHQLRTSRSRRTEFLTRSGWMTHKQEAGPARGTSLPNVQIGDNLDGVRATSSSPSAIWDLLSSPQMCNELAQMSWHFLFVGQEHVVVRPSQFDDAHLSPGYEHVMFIAVQIHSIRVVNLLERSALFGVIPLEVIVLRPAARSGRSCRKVQYRRPDIGVIPLF